MSECTRGHEDAVERAEDNQVTVERVDSRLVIGPDKEIERAGKCYEWEKRKGWYQPTFEFFLKRFMVERVTWAHEINRGRM